MGPPLWQARDKKYLRQLRINIDVIFGRISRKIHKFIQKMFYSMEKHNQNQKMRVWGAYKMQNIGKQGLYFQTKYWDGKDLLFREDKTMESLDLGLDFTRLCR